jgi:pre-mRNA-splicing helicase BRR2
MDTERLLEDACRLLQALVDVISSNGWLRPVLAVMELSQMTVQVRLYIALVMVVVFVRGYKSRGSVCARALAVGVLLWCSLQLSLMVRVVVVVQGLWSEDSPLLQIPHFTRELVEKCNAASVPKKSEDGEDESGPVESVYDVLDLDAATRETLLGMPKHQVCGCAVCLLPRCVLRSSFRASRLHLIVILTVALLGCSLPMSRGSATATRTSR